LYEDITNYLHVWEHLGADLLESWLCREGCGGTVLSELMQEKSTAVHMCNMAMHVCMYVYQLKGKAKGTRATE
jgi:hypothetical protein